MKRRRNILRKSYKHLVGYLTGGKIDPLPLRKSFASYNQDFFRRDLKAATDVALVGLPQGMAFAALAGLPIIYGIMCATIGTLVSPLFSRSQLTVAGPSNATSFMLASFFLAHPLMTAAERMQIVPVIVFFVGIACLIGAFVKITELMQYVSRSVLVGYISGAALLIIVSQMKYLLGLEEPLKAFFQQEGGGRSFFSMMEGICLTFTQMDWRPLSIGATTLLMFFLLKRKFRAFPNFAITLVSMSAFCYLLTFPWTGAPLNGISMMEGFDLQSLALHLPELISPGIFNQLYDIVAVVFGIAFLCMLEQTLMTKNLATRTGESVDLNQDTYAVGMTNTALSFCSSLPSSASLTRSMLNYTSGAATRFSSIYCGLICLLITVILAKLPLTSYIPTSVLAALVIGNALSLFDKKAMRICVRSTKADAAVLWCTFFAALLVPLHTAIFIGVGISITFFLRKASHPALIEYTMSDEGQLKELRNVSERAIPSISIVHVEGNLFFGASELFRAQVQRMVEDPNLKVIILRLKNAHNLDATSVWALDELIRFTREHHRYLLISGASKEVYRILRNSGVLQNLQEGCTPPDRNIFLYSPQNPNYSTRLALIRAQKILGTQKADIRIFFNPAAHPKS